MIDSIVFRVMDLKAHEPLVRFLSQHHNSGIEERRKVIDSLEGLDIVALKKDFEGKEVVDKETGEVTEFAKVLDDLKTQYMAEEQVKRFHIHRYFEDHRTGKTFGGEYRNHIKSSHYNVAYAIQPDKDSIQFDFSIPKYLYMTNVLQFDISVIPCQAFR